MTMKWQLSRTIPGEVQKIGEMILGEDDPYRRIGDRFEQLFPEEEVFEPIYASTGRSANSPLMMALVSVFQMMERVPDRVAARYVATRLDWKYALHLPLDYPGFHFTDLKDFRQRLVAHGWERKLLDELLEKLLDQGYVRPRGKMRTDSTHLLGVVEWLTRIELVLESIRLALQALRKADAGWVREQVPPAFEELHSQRENLYGWSDAQVDAAFPRAAQDGFWLIEQLQRTERNDLVQLAEVVVLQQVLDQQFPQGPNQAPPKKRPSGKQIIASPHEPQARQGVKRDTIWCGYKVQITESCEEDLPKLIVDLAVTNALDQDGPTLPAIQQRLIERQIPPAEQLVDYSYVSADTLINSLKHDIRLRGPAPRDTIGPAGFRQEDFHIDEATRTATCPAGQTSQLWSEQPSGIKLRFPAKTCQACPHFGQCTSSPRGRSLELHRFRRLLHLYRNLAHTDDFKLALHLRAGIEASISEVVRRYDLRHARYRGQAKINLQAAFTAIAANLNRLVRWWVQSDSLFSSLP